MKYTAHVSTVTRPYIRLPVTRTPYTPTDANWATTWIIDETYKAHYHDTSVKISIYAKDPDHSVLTNHIYTDQLSSVTDALTAYSSTTHTTNTHPKHQQTHQPHQPCINTRSPTDQPSCTT